MLNREEGRLITITTSELSDKYPTEAYGSRASLWGCALRDDLVTREVYDKASNFYGRLWNYVGD